MHCALGGSRSQPLVITYPSTIIFIYLYKQWKTYFATCNQCSRIDSEMWCEILTFFRDHYVPDLFIINNLDIYIFVFFNRQNHIVWSYFRFWSWWAIAFRRRRRESRLRACCLNLAPNSTRETKKASRQSILQKLTSNQQYNNTLMTCEYLQRFVKGLWI